MTQEDLLKTKKTNVIRNPARASYDRITAYEIIDSTPMCHVSYIIDGEPYITPTFQRLCFFIVCYLNSGSK